MARNALYVACVAIRTPADEGRARVLLGLDLLEARYLAPVARDGEPWARRVTTQVGEQVKGYRERLRWSARELADRCEQLGYRIEAQVIANMETGRRANVTAAEIVVLAAALGVPPVALMYPVRTDSEVEVVPDRPVSSWPHAIQWFTGEWPIPRLSGFENELDAWEGATGPLNRLRWQEAERRRWRSAVREVGRWERAVREAEDDSVREAAQERVQRSEERVRDVERGLAVQRGAMRAAGIDPGVLSADLAQVDDLPEAQAREHDAPEAQA